MSQCYQKMTGNRSLLGCKVQLNLSATDYARSPVTLAQYMLCIIIYCESLADTHACVTTIKCMSKLFAEINLEYL